MPYRPILMASGLFTALSLLCLIATIALGISLGGDGPRALDFSDPATLAALHRNGDVGLLLSRMALLAPILALGAGLGWYFLLKETSELVGLGVLLWYIGMTFIVWQDAAEVALIAQLPAEFASASPIRRRSSPPAASWAASLASHRSSELR